MPTPRCLLSHAPMPVVLLAVAVTLSPMFPAREAGAQIAPVILPPSIKTPGRNIKRPNAPGKQPQIDLAKEAAKADGVFVLMISEFEYQRASRSSPPVHSFTLKYTGAQRLKGKLTSRGVLRVGLRQDVRPLYTAGQRVIALTKGTTAYAIVEGSVKNITLAKAAVQKQAAKPAVGKVEGKVVGKPVGRPAALAVEPKRGGGKAGADDKSPVASAKASLADDLTVELRPLLEKLTVTDPVRFAVHLAGKDGPIDHQHPQGQRSMDRLASLLSMTLRVQGLDGVRNIKLTKLTSRNKPPMYGVAGNPTFIFELKRNSVDVLRHTGQAESSFDTAPFKALGVGEYKVSVSGKVFLNPINRRIKGQPAINKPAEAIAFEVGPVAISIQKPSDKLLSLTRIELAAQKAVLEHVVKAGDDREVQDQELLTVGGGDGKRIVRIRVNIKPPKQPEVKGPNGIRIAPRLPHSWMGYYRYEAEMTPDGKAIEVKHQRTGGCIAEGTPVLTTKGEKPIDQVVRGDKVIGFDPATGKRVINTVLHKMETVAFETLQAGKLRLTASHPVFSKGQWRRADQVLRGDPIVAGNAGKPAGGKAAAYRLVKEKVPVYDLMVDGNHTFFAGNRLVHNKSVMWTPRAFVPWYILWSRVP